MCSSCCFWFFVSLDVSFIFIRLCRMGCGPCCLRVWYLLASDACMPCILICAFPFMSATEISCVILILWSRAVGVVCDGGCVSKMAFDSLSMNCMNSFDSFPYESMASGVNVESSFCASMRYLLFFWFTAVVSIAAGVRLRFVFVGVPVCLTVVSVNDGRSSPGKN